METIQYYRAMLGICRQRAQMESEGASFWLEEADILEKLITNGERMRALGMDPSPDVLADRAA